MPRRRSTTSDPDRFRGRTPSELLEMRDVIDSRLRLLHADEDGEARNLSVAQQAEFDQLVVDRDELQGLLDQWQRARSAMGRPRALETGMVNHDRGLSFVVDPGDVLRMADDQVRDQALHALERDGRDLPAAAQDKVDGLLRSVISADQPFVDGAVVARRILLTESPAYRSGFAQLMTQSHPVLSAEEAEAVRAVQRVEAQRAMSENVPAAGGFAIPALIDPSIILTAQDSGNPFRQLARTQPVTGPLWKGVSSAGVTWSYDTEGSVVSDDSPSLDQPAITVHMARGFIPYTIEVEVDYPRFAEEMAALLAAGLDELQLQAFTTGSGSGEPFGIFTAIDNNTNQEIATVTSGVFGAPDLYAAWEKLAAKYRRRAAWLMGVGVNDRIRQMGVYSQEHAFTLSLPGSWVDQLFGRGVYDSAYCPDFSGTTGSNILIAGSFENYLIAERIGMNLERIQTLFDASTGRPNGRRGFFAWARHGADSINDKAFVLLQTK